MSFLIVAGIGKRQGDHFILKDISFTQQPFQKIAIAGETGCGKSTLLKTIAGIVQPTAGEVRFEDKRVIGPDEKLMPGHKNIAYLSQYFELRNNYRVEEELKYTNQLADEEAQLIYEVCRISHLLKRKTTEVSGGEKQRIAMARQLISMPKLFLLDEPYSNLDMIHKSILKNVIRDIGDLLDITCILVSHDPDDTLSWADEIIVMKDGEIVQHGTPMQVYYQPASEYVAGLFGKYSVMTPALCQAFAASQNIEMDITQMFLRPGQLAIGQDKSKGLRGTVTGVTFLGSIYEVRVLVEEAVLFIQTTTKQFVKGDNIYIALINAAT